MYCLGIDTSNKNLCVLISENDCVIAKYNRFQERAHSRLLTSVIERLLDKCRLSVTQMDYLAVVTGPGSFTGIRIGLATVKGLSLSLNKPIISFSSLDLLAFQLQQYKHRLICPLIDAKRQNVYAAFYQSMNNRVCLRSRYFLCSIDELLKKIDKQVIFTGDALAVYKEKIIENNKFEALFADKRFWYSNPDYLAGLCYSLYKRKNIGNATQLTPLYLYPETCTVCRKKRRT